MFRIEPIWMHNPSGEAIESLLGGVPPYARLLSLPSLIEDEARKVDESVMIERQPLGWTRKKSLRLALEIRDTTYNDALIVYKHEGIDSCIAIANRNIGQIREYISKSGGEPDLLGLCDAACDMISGIKLQTDNLEAFRDLSSFIVITRKRIERDWREDYKDKIKERRQSIELAKRDMEEVAPRIEGWPSEPQKRVLRSKYKGTMIVLRSSGKQVGGHGS